ncbi:hypothetical protein [Actinopolymorpha sp. B9G3]|uniref:magnesium chelatase subunit ChlI family protein n=1 Tax=Actinopolymorpha sp. B9G3 TaxID=3158970 RepID=UPI0032D93218
MRPGVREGRLLHEQLVESTEVVAARVGAARERQAHRYAGLPWSLNAHVAGYELRRRWPPEPSALPVLESHLSSGWLTARGADRVLRIDWASTLLMLH